MENNFIALLVGPSASGKSTIANSLERLYGWQQVQSITTRPRRFLNERGHLFFSDDEFNLIPPHEMVAYTEYAGYRYCATEGQISKAQVYVIDIDGVHEFKRLYKGAKEVITFFVATSSSAIAKRLEKRGVPREEINARLAFDKKAFSRERIDGIDPIYVSGLGSPDANAVFIFSHVNAVLENESKRKGE